MRSLVEFIMRGRAHACGVALAGYFLPFLSPSTIGLVTLKKGLIEGCVVALWALLPILLGWFVSDLEAYGANRLLTIVSCFSLVIAVLVAQILRITMSWQWSLIAVVVASVVATLSLNIILPEGLEQLTPKVISLLSGGFNTEVANDMIKQKLFVLSLLAWGLVLTAVVSLIVSRWWQGLVFNPGGFVKEFHSLRLDARVGLGTLLVIVFGFLFYREHAMWFQLATVPLLVAGIALAHHIASVLKLSATFLFFMYTGLLLFSPAFALILICLGFVDSQWNLRAKLLRFKD